MYFVQERRRKAKPKSSDDSMVDTSRLVAPLDTLERIALAMLLFGFPCMTVGLILGAVLLHQAAATAPCSSSISRCRADVESGRSGKLDGLFVYDIDDLQQVAASHIAERQSQAGDAESLVEAEVERFHQRRRAVNVAPAIVSLQRQAEEVFA